MVTDRVANQIVVLDADSGERLDAVACRREPGAVAVDAPGQLAVVVHRRPHGPANDPRCAIGVDLVQVSRDLGVTELTLPPGSTNGRGVVLSPDGRWAYVAHTIGRTHMPTEQIEYGWINANALSIIDLIEERYHATVLLDTPGRGAAGPFGLALSADGATLLATLSGVHELVRIDRPGLHAALVDHEDVLSTFRQLVRSPAALTATAEPSQWHPHIEGDASALEIMIALRPSGFAQGLFVPDLALRQALDGIGPRGLAVSVEADRMAVAMHFSGNVLAGSSTSPASLTPFELPLELPSSPAATGRRIFHDATYSWGGWQSCATCHPEGREDGLVWDLPNDGVTNPKNTRSLVGAPRTTPLMTLAVRADLESCVQAGFAHILFKQPDEDAVPALEAFIASLRGLPKPGPRDEAAISRGRELFHGPAVGCSRCHPGPLWTDRRRTDVGTALHATDKGKAYDTTSLVECWRNAPYLAGGQAATLMECLTTCNPQDRHGLTHDLTEAQLQDLCAFLDSL